MPSIHSLCAFDAIEFAIHLHFWRSRHILLSPFNGEHSRIYEEQFTFALGRRANSKREPAMANPSCWGSKYRPGTAVLIVSILPASGLQKNAPDLRLSVKPHSATKSSPSACCQSTSWPLVFAQHPQFKWFSFGQAQMSQWIFYLLTAVLVNTVLTLQASKGYTRVKNPHKKRWKIHKSKYECFKQKPFFCGRNAAFVSFLGQWLDWYRNATAAGIWLKWNRNDRRLELKWQNRINAKYCVVIHWRINEGKQVRPTQSLHNTRSQIASFIR